MILKLGSLTSHGIENVIIYKSSSCITLFIISKDVVNILRQISRVQLGKNSKRRIFVKEMMSHWDSISLSNNFIMD